MIRSLFIASAVLGVTFVIWMHQQLPETVAIHFGTNGLADNWSSNKASLQMAIISFLFTTGLFLGIPWMVRQFPTRWISFPDRDYWFSPERRDSTMKRAQPWFDFSGLSTNLFLLLTFWLVYKAHETEPQQFDSEVMIWGLVIYFVFITVWLFGFYRHFKAPRNNGE